MELKVIQTDIKDVKELVDIKQKYRFVTIGSKLLTHFTAVLHF